MAWKPLHPLLSQRIRPQGLRKPKRKGWQFSTGVDWMVARAQRLGDKVSKFIKESRAARHQPKEKVRHPTHFAKPFNRRDGRIR